jgi:hypothetical protein
LGEAINSQLWVQRFVNWLSPRPFAENARRKINVAGFFQLFTNGTRHAYAIQQERGFSIPATDDELSKRSYQ